MVNGSSILVFVLIQKRFVGEVVHRLQAEQGVVEVVVVGFDILQGGDALTGREFVPDFACLTGIYLILAGNLVVLFPESFEAIVGRCAGCRFLFGRTGISGHHNRGCGYAWKVRRPDAPAARRRTSF